MAIHKEKYITFSPYCAGLCNIIMSYEIFLAIAHITNRTVVLPPNCFIAFISKTRENKNDWIDLWQIFDKNVLLQEFNCIEHEQVPEFRDKHIIMQSRNSYTGLIGMLKVTLNSVKFPNANPNSAITHEVLVNQNDGSEDLKNFSNTREIIELNCDEQFLHFENNLFGHYWYNVYPGGENKRNELKDKINQVFKYHDKFYQYSDVVRHEIGPYNAIHVRRNDFLDTRKNEIQCVNAPEKIMEMVDKLPFDDKSLPLYISTDEQDRSFFNLLGEKYDIHFYEDFEYQFGDDFEEDNLHIAVLEQTICSQSENFFGTYLSTFSKRINIMRGLEGRQADDHLGINHLPETPYENILDAFPWSKRRDNKWHWNLSSYYQWMKEIDGKLI
jgi:hypothetical protein